MMVLLVGMILKIDRLIEDWIADCYDDLVDDDEMPPQRGEQFYLSFSFHDSAP